MNTKHATRRVIALIRHACDGTRLHRPVRALAPLRRKRFVGEAALREVRRLRNEARIQAFAVSVLAVAAILFVAALATATVTDAVGTAPKFQHGLAVIERFVGGLFS